MSLPLDGCSGEITREVMRRMLQLESDDEPIMDYGNGWVHRELSRVLKEVQEERPGCHAE